MKKLLLAALLGGALAGGHASAQSGGSGGLAGGSPGSPGDGPSAGTSTPYMGSSAARSATPGMREGAPLPGDGQARGRRASNRRAADGVPSATSSRAVRKRSGG